MNKEWLMIASMGLGGILFAVGGTGFKPARRFILPFFLGGIALLSGVLWWKCLILCLGLMGAFHLGYGSKTPYWPKFIVGCAFVAPTLILGFTLWQIITPITFIVMFRLSNWKPLASEFVWKIVEFLTGTLIGVTVAQLIK